MRRLELKGVRPSRASVHPRFTPEPIIGPHNDADELILGWCNNHGLLGLVPVLSNSIRPADGNHHHHRDGGVWSTLITTGTTTHLRGDDSADREAAPPGFTPGVTWLNPAILLYEEKPLDHIELFFRADETPRPNSQQFWGQYGEPIQQFTHWVGIFVSLVDCVSQSKDTDAIRRAHSILNALAQSAAPSFRFNAKRNRLDEERVPAGLLASYALMFLWDSMEKRRALRCENCDSYFVSNDPRARYCSPRCRNTAQSRRYRLPKKEEKHNG
jgi:hypothetical protein